MCVNQKEEETQDHKKSESKAPTKKPSDSHQWEGKDHGKVTWPVGSDSSQGELAEPQRGKCSSHKEEDMYQAIDERPLL